MDENWTIKKAECLRIDATELWCYRRLLRVPWTARRWNQSILKEINSEYSLEGLTLKLKLQFFGHLIQRADSLEKTLVLGKIEVRRRREYRAWDICIASPTQWTNWEITEDREAWHATVHEMAESDMTEQLNINKSHLWGCQSSPKGPASSYYTSTLRIRASSRRFWGRNHMDTYSTRPNFHDLQCGFKAEPRFGRPEKSSEVRQILVLERKLL